MYILHFDRDCGEYMKKIPRKRWRSQIEKGTRMQRVKISLRIYIRDEWRGYASLNIEIALQSALSADFAAYRCFLRHLKIFEIVAIKNARLSKSSSRVLIYNVFNAGYKWHV